jgi:membrane-bound lytic murein transglycosylase MltF
MYVHHRVRLGVVRVAVRLALAATALLMLSTATAQDALSRAQPYRDDMAKVARQTWGMRAPVALLAAQIDVESAWRCDAVSPVGARGCAQFMPATAEDMARLYPELCAPANPFSAEWAFRCRDRYMLALINALKPYSSGMSACDYFAFGFKAYNGGLTWVNRDRRKALALGRNPDNWHQVNQVNAGRKASAFKENKDYPVRIFTREARYADWGGVVGCD